MDTRKLKLGDCLSMIRNGAQIKQQEGAGGIPITRIETLSNGLFNRDRMGYANIFDTSEYEDYILQENDILMSHINSRAFLGRSVQYHKIGSESIIHGMNLLRIKTNPEILDCNYAFYFFQSPYFKKCVDSIRTDAVNQSSINISNICSIDINIPSLAIQQRIASILGAFDRKIDLNRQINQNLEALVQQLYNYWFVQFDFPNENGKPYKSHGGQMAYYSQLKRVIPQGWDVVKLGTLCDFSNGINYDKSVEGDTQYKIVNVRNISSSKTIIDSMDLDVICLPSKQADNYLIDSQCILIARSGTPGATRIIENVSNCIYCGFIIKCTPHTAAHRLYLTFLLKQYEGTSLTQTGGSILKNVSQETLKAIWVCVPPKDLISNFNQIVLPLIEEIHKNMVQSNTLIKQRNDLLPLLMNGQVNSDLSAC